MEFMGVGTVFMGEVGIHGVDGGIRGVGRGRLTNIDKEKGKNTPTVGGELYSYSVIHCTSFQRLFSELQYINIYIHTHRNKYTHI